MKWYRTLFLSLAMCCVAPDLNAQISLDLAGKKYIIPSFRENSLTSKESIIDGLSPIEQSPNNLEIRFNYSAGLGSSMIVLRGDKLSLWADCYYYTIPSLWKPAVALPVTTITTNAGHKMGMVSKRIELSHRADSIIAILLANDVFTMQNENILLDSLNKANIPYKNEPWLDGSWGNVFVIKADNKYRSFNTIPETDSQNPSMEVFAKRVRLVKLFTGLYRLSRLPFPGW